MKQWIIKLRMSDQSVVRTVVFAENTTNAVRVATAQFSGAEITSQPEEMRTE